MLTRPRLPAAVTTTTPAFQSFSTARQSGSVVYDSCTAAPSDRLTTRMPNCCRLPMQ